MIIDRLIYTLARRWLLFFNLVLAIYVGLPMLAPVLMQVGLTGPARAIYTVYSPLCHQLSSRSFFLFGEQIAYPRAIAGSSLTPIEAYMPTIPEFAGASTDPALWPTFLQSARDFLGNDQLGYKMALCQRDISMYLSMLLGGLLFALLRHRINIRPMPFWLFILIGLTPIALDGFSQLFSQFFVNTNIDLLAQLFPLRESSPFIRSLTGWLFGLSVAWLVLPRLEYQMAIMAEDQFRKLAAYGAADDQLPTD